MSVANAGLRMSLFQRVSKVPVMYMSEPLSATMSPCFCIARKILRTFGSLVRSAGSAPFTFVLSRSRAPIGSAPGCRAGAVRRRIHVAVGRAHGDPERMADVGERRVPRLVVADEAREDREAGRVGRRPRVGPPVVRVHVEERAGARVPLSTARRCNRRCRARRDGDSCSRRSAGADRSGCAGRRSPGAPPSTQCGCVIACDGIG